MMPGGSPGSRTTVVAVTWQSAAVLPGLLSSLEHGMRGVSWDLLVVDNASRDDSAAIAERDERARVLRMTENLGFAAAVNRGIRSAAEGHVLIVNPDVRLGPGCGAALVAALETKPAPTVLPTGIAAPLLEDESGTRLPSLRFEPSIPRALAEALLGTRRACAVGWGETDLRPTSYAEATTADWATGAILMISHACLMRTGELDESFFLYSEDTEYALRARERGFATRLAPAARAVHLGGASREDPELWCELTRNKLRLYKRRHGRFAAGGFRAAALARELRLAASGNRISRAGARTLLAAGAAR